MSPARCCASPRFSELSRSGSYRAGLGDRLAKGLVVDTVHRVPESCGQRGRERTRDECTN